MNNDPGSLQPVGFLRRLGAIFYDVLLFGGTIFIVGGIVATLISRMLGMENIPPDSPLANAFFVFYVLLSFLMLGWFWTHGGQTLGMRAWKIRIITDDGKKLNWQQAFFRFVSALFSWACFGVGFLIAIFDKEKLGWHDRFSRTRLIRIQ